MKKILALIAALFIVTPLVTAQSVDEENDGRWTSIGMGQLVDGWVNIGQTYDVVIQQDASNPKRYRVWNPFEGIKGDLDPANESEYIGQIVFDVSDPENVMVEHGKPAGYVWTLNPERYQGEMYILNFLCFTYQTLLKAQGASKGEEYCMNMAKNTAKNSKKNSYVDDEGNIVIPYTRHAGSTFAKATETVENINVTAKIIMPSTQSRWEFKATADVLAFDFDGTPVSAVYKADTKSYVLDDVTNANVVTVTVKPNYVNTLIKDVTVSPEGGKINVSDNSKSFSFNRGAFPGNFTFTVNTFEATRRWTIVVEDDILVFDINGADPNIEYDAENGAYVYNTDATSGTLHVGLQNGDASEDFNIVGVKPTFNREATFATLAVIPAPALDADGKGFSLNLADYTGVYSFQVQTEYVGAFIAKVQTPIVSTTQGSAYIRIKYDSSLVPANSVIKAYFYRSDAPDEIYLNYVVGLASGADINVLGLSPDTEYEYIVQFIVYDDNGDEISRNRPITVNFTTKSAPKPAAGVSVADYLWDNTEIPENKYGIFTFWTYRTGKNGSSLVVPELTPETPVIRGTYFKKNNESGKRELTLLFAHMLPNPPYVTEDQKILTANKFFIVKNPAENSTDKETYYMPEPPADWDDNDGDLPFGYTIKNNVPFTDAFRSVNMRYYEGGKGSTLEDKVWGIDMLPYFHLEVNEKVYNVIVTIGFDDNDADYENPVYLNISYEEEPQTRLIGTIAQTSTEYDPAVDNVGGWHTWVPLTSTGDSENPYPYVYDFIAHDTQYDFSFTFDNKRLFDQLGKDGVYESFKLQEIYPHNMAWYADFEAPSTWHAQPISREVSNNRSNYYPGYIGPYISTIRDDKQGNHAPSFCQSIKLVDLVPGHHYQLVLDHPSYGWETDRDKDRNPEGFTFIDNALGYISLVDYDALDGDVNAYQLVADTQNPGEYYTYDYTKTGKTYKVTLEEDGTVKAYEAVTGIDESEDYKDDKYQFTDKIFVFTNGYDNKNVDDRENNVSVDILAERADIVLVDNDVHRIIETEGGVSLATIYTMKDLDKPLASKIFDIQKHTLTYQRGYRTCPENTLELFVSDRPVTHYLEWDYKGDMESKGYVDKTRRLYDPETVKFDNVLTPGTLVVPTPRECQPVYDMAYNRVAQGDESNQINLRFYANDLRGDEEYLPWTYTLPAEKSLHAHDYHVTMPYERSNVTEALGEIMNELAEDGKPYIKFNLVIKDEDTNYQKIELDPNNYTDAGFYNADLGYIFDEDVNKKSLATRTMSYDKSREEYTNIYKRWVNDVTAVVSLDLTAPEFGEIDYNNQINDDRSRTTVTNVYREVVNIDGTDVLAVTMPGFWVTNTDDFIGNVNPKLRTGDNSEEYTTLYLVEYDPPIGFSKRERIRKVLSAEEMFTYHFPIVALQENYTSDQAWPKDPVDLSAYAGLSFNFEVRNIYLFPIDNEGFMRKDEANPNMPDNNDDGDSEGEEDDDDVLVNPRAKAPDVEPEPVNNNYHAVTTPVTEHTLVFTKDTVTGVSGVVGDSDENVTLARVSAGSVELLLDGVMLYHVDGHIVARDRGVYAVTPGVYIAVKDNNMQKLFVQ